MDHFLNIRISAIFRIYRCVNVVFRITIKKISFFYRMKSLHMHNSYMVGCIVWQLQLPISNVEGVISICMGQVFYGSPGITITACIGSHY